MNHKGIFADSLDRHREALSDVCEGYVNGRIERDKFVILLNHYKDVVFQEMTLIREQRLGTDINDPRR